MSTLSIKHRFYLNLTPLVEGVVETSAMCSTIRDSIAGDTVLYPHFNGYASALEMQTSTPNVTKGETKAGHQLVSWCLPRRSKKGEAPPGSWRVASGADPVSSGSRTDGSRNEEVQPAKTRFNVSGGRGAG